MISTYTSKAGPGRAPFRVAEIVSEPSEDQISWLRSRKVDGLSIRPKRGSRRAFPMAWMADVGTVRFLEIVTPRPVATVPAETASGLEVLQVQGRLVSAFNLDEAPQLRSITIAADLVDGPLSRAPGLEHCGLERLSVFSSRIIEGCHALKSAYFEADPRAALPLWDFRASENLSVEKLTLINIGVRSLEGISAMPHLRELVVAPRNEEGLDVRLDLSPLVACRGLQKLVLHGNGTLYNAQVLDELQGLEKVTVLKGGVEPHLQDREWLSVL